MQRALVPCVLLSLLVPATARAAPPGRHDVRTPVIDAPRILDLGRRLDSFDFDLHTTNFGSLAYDLETGGPGLEFPKHSDKHAMFATGLWVGAQVAGEKRVTVAEYAMEWQAGRILGGVAEDVNAPGLHTWKVVPAGGYFSPYDTAFASSIGGDPVVHHGWGEYAATGGPVGAPLTTKRLPVPGSPPDSVDVPAPDLPGAIALWSIFNDANPAIHTAHPGSTTPLGLEVRQVVYAHPDVPQVAYVRWTLVHRGAAPLDSAYVGFWADPDIGSANDDKVGWSAEHQMAYAYNGQNADGVYGSAPAASGIRFLSGPPGVAPAALIAMANGDEPQSATESYGTLQGFDPWGNDPIDPTTGLVSRFMFPGNPLTTSGWLDPVAVDRRFLLSVGPFDLAPGDSAEFTFAFVVAQGLNRFDSIHRLFCWAGFARNGFETGFEPPYPPGPEGCSEVVSSSCPVPSSTWAAFCADPSQLPPNALDFMGAVLADASRSVALVPPYDESFCDSVSVPDAGSARRRAVREYLAFLANIHAMPGTMSPEGRPVGLSSDEPVSCAWSDATTVGDLAEKAPLEIPLEAEYVETVDDGPREYQPVDWGGQAYSGGVGFGSWFFSSSLNPGTDRDSFPDVEIRFDPTSTQKAYRYLRLELPDESLPPTGREYRYGGYRSVPLEVVDRTTGERLEVGFVERAIVDVNGTLLGPAFQPATFDSTWGPSAGDIGSREYLYVLSHGDGGTPRNAMEADGAIAGPPHHAVEPPVLYAAWLRLAEEGNLPEPGEKLVITPFGTADSPGVDARLLELFARPQDDSKTIAGYEEIVACLAAINAGIGLGLECDVSTPVALTLEEGIVEGGVARLAWYVAGEDAGPFDLARRPAGDDAAPWSMLARLSVDGTRRVSYVDRAIAPGERWTYGLFDPADPSRPLDTVTLDVPGTIGFSLRVSTGGRGVPARAHFTLPARGEAHLVLYDAAGRRRHIESFGVLEAGPHSRPLGVRAGAGPGLYFAKLLFGGRSVGARAVLLD